MRSILSLSRSTKLFIGLIILYTALTFILPASHVTKATLNISSTQYYYLLLTIRIPIIAVWCLAYYAYRCFHNYSERIKDTPEGIQFAAISQGMFWIVWGFLIPAIMSSLLNAIANQKPGFTATAIIITNYMYVLVSVLAFTLISRGTYQLAMLSKTRFTAGHMRGLITVLALVSVIFCYLLSRNLRGTALGDSYNAFYLPNILVWLSLTVPYLYAWFLGLIAAAQLTMIAHSTPGVIYRQSLQYVAAGIIIVVIALIANQYFRGIVPRTGHLKLGAALLVTYMIYILSGIGSLLLAVGAKRLLRIEDI